MKKERKKKWRKKSVLMDEEFNKTQNKGYLLSYIRMRFVGMLDFHAETVYTKRKNFMK